MTRTPRDTPDDHDDLGWIVEKLGLRMRKRRVHLGLKLSDVSQKSGLSLSYVSNLERGRGSNPTVAALLALSQALQMSLSELLASGDSECCGRVDYPTSLVAFSRTWRFRVAAERYSKAHHVQPEEMRDVLLRGLAAAPRRGIGNPNKRDWQRLLDAFCLILGGY